jgi:hypothetical protein
VWTQEFGLVLLHVSRLCIELIPTFSHEKGSQATAHDEIEVCLPISAAARKHDRAGAPHREVPPPDTLLALGKPA